MSFLGDPRLRSPDYARIESDFERAEFLERQAEHHAERLRDSEILENNIGVHGGRKPHREGTPAHDESKGCRS